MTIKAFGPRTLHHLEAALKHEWKEKNSLGVYASSSILGTNTKTGHGLMVVPKPRTKIHHVLLSSLDETLYIGDRGYPLSTHLYRDGVYPQGYEQLESFYRFPFPSWIYRIEGLTILKMVMTIADQKTVLIRYQLLSSYGDFVRLTVRPITAFRETTTVLRQGGHLEPMVRTEKGVINLSLVNGTPSLRLFHNAGVVDREGKWMKNLQYRGSQTKKSSLQEEDLFSPCELHFAFLEEKGVYLCATTEKRQHLDPYLLELQEKRRRHVDVSEV